MRVKRDFDQVYSAESDPWNIGDADYGRYNIYYDLILSHTKSHNKILDIGCGFGAFLARFKEDFKELHGFELSEEAVAKGEKRFPFIKYYQGSVTNIGRVVPDENRYSVIIYSDVIAYFTEKEKVASLQWISDHLTKDGIAFIAAWSPGGKYLTYDELRRLVNRYFSIEKELLLEDTEHAVFIARKKQFYVAITVDYETWQPIPSGKAIDWDRDILGPADALLELCGREGAKITFMAEMGEYFWLRENQPDIAERMEQQWKKAVRMGHDVQLHLHPSWLPELGAKYESGTWHWDFSKAKADDYPHDLGQLIQRCRSQLETILRAEDPSYKVTSFRAGAYQVQPFSRLHEALADNGILCDSSVYSGGCSEERGYDFRMAYSDHNPYYANPYDPQLKAPPGDQQLIEIPVFTFRPDQRWFLDGKGGSGIAEQLFTFLNRLYQTDITSEVYRRKKRIRKRLLGLYFKLRKYHRLANRIIPKKIIHSITDYGPEESVRDEYFVMIGHTKADHNLAGIADSLRRLKENPHVRFVTLSEMVRAAEKDLRDSCRESARDEADFQVKREYTAIMGEARNDAQSFLLQDTIPLDRESVLDLGCGAGYWADRIAKLYPWMAVTGVDWGEDFIEKAREKFASDRVSFQKEDFGDLSFQDGSFDCVYADNTLEHSFDVDRTLTEAYRVLKDGGVLVAAVPSDARNSSMICDNHTWKTAPHEVHMRLENSGFVNIEVREVDTFKELGMPPYPPANDKMMYIRAWKKKRPFTPVERAVEAMDWTYRHLRPDEPSTSANPSEIIQAGHAWCYGYMIVLGSILEREGMPVRWVTMHAKDHPRGRGDRKVDTHNVILAGTGKDEVILDPMANTLIPHPLQEVLKDPSLAKEKQRPDDRYVERGYHLYDTEFWYQRVFKTDTETPVRRDPTYKGKMLSALRAMKRLATIRRPGQ